jgi:DNA modification methylase
MNEHERNPREHAEPGTPKWNALSRSLAEDYFDPLVLNRRNRKLVSGAFRRKVMLHDGFTVADVVVVDYDEETHYARMIAANRHFGDWCEEILAALARELDAAGLDPALCGLDDQKALAQLFDGPKVQDDSDTAAGLISQAEEVAKKWNVRLGDLYAAGEHRILCGDCTLAENWQLLLEGGVADMVWTDPPYNVNYDSIQQRRVDLSRAEGKTPHAKPEAIINDDLSEADYGILLRACFDRAIEFTRPGGAIYVAHADSYGLLTRQALADAGWSLAQCLIWVKSAFTLGRQDYQWQHEPILYGWRPGAGHYWQGGYRQGTVLDDDTKLAGLSKAELIAVIHALKNERDTTVIREPRGTGNALHPTVKPLPLVARQIHNSSRRGETVLELFGGSGTTVLAAQQTGRRAVATELDPKFCAVILERLTLAGLKVGKVSEGNIPAAQLAEAA